MVDARVTLTIGTNGLHFDSTDETGDFAITDLTPGVYYAQVVAPGFSAHQQIVEIPDSREPSRLDLSLSTGSSLSGQVTEADGTTPVPQAVVTLLDQDGALVGATSADENGYYEFFAVPAGDYRLRVWDDVFAFETVSANIADGADATVNCPAADGSVQGTVTSSGAPVADMSVVAKLSGAQAPDAILLARTTDEFGQYEFPALPPGTYWIGTVGTNGLSASGRYETVTAGSATPADFALSASSTLTGSVRDLASSAPIQGVQLSLRSLAGIADDSGITAESNELGNFEITDAAPRRVPSGRPGLGLPLLRVGRHGDRQR